jgi:hypothetical protein
VIVEQKADQHPCSSAPNRASLLRSRPPRWRCTLQRRQRCKRALSNARRTDSVSMRRMQRLLRTALHQGPAQGEEHTVSASRPAAVSLSSGRTCCAQARPWAATAARRARTVRRSSARSKMFSSCSCRMLAERLPLRVTLRRCRAQLC